MQRKYLNLGLVVVLGVVGVSTALPSCVPTQTTCDDGIGCVPGDAGTGGATSGAGGKAGTGGNAPGGSAAGKSGSAAGGTPNAGGGGMSAGAAGEAGMGGMGGNATLPCDGACVAPKPVCDEPNDTCVQCLKTEDCSSGTATKCDTTAKACVQCLAPADCLSATAAKCDTGTCAKCTSNDDCSHIAGKTVCDTVAGECVQCTGKDYGSCGQSMGKPLICDSTTRKCTTNKERSAGLCSPCVADAQCQTTQLCVKEQFGTPTKQDVGYFCFSRKTAAVGADCTLIDNQPYVSTLKNQTSIDGETADLCGLRSSTCIANNQFSVADCNTSSAADDQKCGFAPGKDSKCLPFGASQFRCTMTCGSGDDCPSGFPCDTTVTPRVCKLEQ